MRAFAACSGAVLVVLLMACSPERQDWRSAEAADTIEAYDRFLERHPGSARAPQARARIAQLAERRDWERASQIDTQQAYRRFLAQYPQGLWAHEARIRIESFQLGTPAGPQPEPTPAAAAPSDTAPTSRSGFGIQLGAFSSEESARAEWKHVAAKFPRELGSLTPEIPVSNSAGTTLHRLQVPVPDEKRARALCERLKAASQPCVVVLPQ